MPLTALLAKDKNIGSVDKIVLDTTVQEIIQSSKLLHTQGQHSLKGLIKGKNCEKPMEESSLESLNKCSFRENLDVLKEQESRVQTNQSPLLIFISFSMPPLSLKAYSRDVQKIKGRLILQGLHKNSFKETQKKMIELGITGDIDPPLFEKYAVKDVPTFIHTTLKDNPGSYDQVQGHISLKQALTLFNEKGDIKGADDLLKVLGSKE